jgi:hypothetical protein
MPMEKVQGRYFSASLWSKTQNECKKYCFYLCILKCLFDLDYGSAPDKLVVILASNRTNNPQKSLLDSIYSSIGKRRTYTHIGNLRDLQIQWAHKV